MPVLRIGNAETVSTHLVGDCAAIPPDDEYAIGLLHPALGDTNSELSIAALRFLFHGQFDKLNPLLLFCGNPL